MTVLWVATTNQGKMNEFKTLLRERGVEIHFSSELPVYSSPAETGKTFLDNARIKARFLKAIKDKVWVVADDSGLEVEGLGNLPGVFSARYAGDKASDRENTAKVLKMLQMRSPQNRKALFRCVFVAYSPEGREHVIETTLEGSLAEKACGTAGFGYDSIFIPQGESKTLGELGLVFKNRVSHRAQAIRQLSELLVRDSGREITSQ